MTVAAFRVLLLAFLLLFAPGLRITNYKKRAVIAFTADAKRVSIIGIYYGGQDYESALLSELDE